MNFRQLAVAAVIVATAASAAAATADRSASTALGAGDGSTHVAGTRHEPVSMMDPALQPLAGSFHDMASTVGATTAAAEVRTASAAPVLAVTDPETCALMLAGVGAGLFMTLRRSSRGA